MNPRDEFNKINPFIIIIIFILIPRLLPPLFAFKVPRGFIPFHSELKRSLKSPLESPRSHTHTHKKDTNDKGWTDDNIRERCCFGSASDGGSCRCTAGHLPLEIELWVPSWNATKNQPRCWQQLIPDD